MKKKGPKKLKIIQSVTIEKIWHGGVGIARHSDGRKIIVSWGVLPGMVVDLLVTKQKKDFTEGKLYHVHSYGTEFTLDRDAVRCPHYVFHEEDGLTHDGMWANKVWCGGCRWQILTYEKQLLLKQHIVNDSFRHIKDIIDKVGMKPFVPAPQTFGYRNKIEYSFGKYITNESPEQHHRQMWFHKKGMFSKVIDVDQCYLVSDEAQKLYKTMKQLLVESWLPVYDQKTHEWFLRHLVVREGTNTGNFLVNLSVSGSQIEALWIADQRNAFQKELQANEYLTKTITSFVITMNDGLADIVKGEGITTSLLWGEEAIYEKLLFPLSVSDVDETDDHTVEANFRVSPFSFFQTNTLGAQRLFQTAMDSIGEIDGHILDLYCGTGTIGLSFLKAGKGEGVMGIEIVPDAIVDAVRNAKVNGLSDRAYFVSGKAEDLVSTDQYISARLDKIKLVVVDPPRDGLHKSVVEFLLNLKKHHDFTLLYISCNPVTMARDLQLLLGEYYNLRSIQPVDMFPHTHHVEMIWVLS